MPAIGEVLPGFEIVLWNGIFAPAKTPPEVVSRISAAIRAVLADPAMQNTPANQGSKPVGSTPQEFERLLGGEIDKWGKLVKLSGASAD